MTYYLHATATKTGKTRYVMTRAGDGALTKLPEGYAITESVNGQVSVGRARPRLITETEEAMVTSELKNLGLDSYRCETKGCYLTVYEPVHQLDSLSTVLRKMDIHTEALKKSLAEIADKAPFEAVMRFQLCDEDNRLFEAQRMTYRGEGGWMSLHKFGPLQDLAGKYLKHLGKDSFYELI